MHGEWHENGAQSDATVGSRVQDHDDIAAGARWLLSWQSSFYPVGKEPKRVVKILNN